ncbi:MAG: hypothetical protein ACE5KM_11215 [Planctomycetaceae bacterium]
MINRIFRPLEYRPGAGLSPAEPPAWTGPVDDSNDPVVQHLDCGVQAFIPKCYEDRYPYPLLVWLSGDSTPGRDFRTQMCGISSRNCLGLQIHLNAAGGHAAGDVPALIRQNVGRLRESRHVHTERIFVVGVGRTSRSALGAFLARPEWFGGAVTLGGELTDRPVVPFRNPELRGKRLFLASTRAHGAAKTTRAARTLHAAGLRVTTRHYDAAAGSPVIHRDLNHWLMQGLGVPV